MLIARALACGRGGQRALEGVDLAVGPGQALVLRGPNGVGKTTLLRVLAGLQPPMAGQLDAPPDSCTLATHADGVKSMLTVVENLQFWASVHGRAVPAGIFAQFDLVRLADRLAGTLSAGQKRRVGLARLGVTGRRIWLLDEPTVSLDQASVARFAQVLAAHLANGGSAVIATHLDLDIPADVLDLSRFRAMAPVEEAFL